MAIAAGRRTTLVVMSRRVRSRCDSNEFLLPVQALEPSPRRWENRSRDILSLALLRAIPTRVGAAEMLTDPDLDLAYSLASLWEIGIKMAGKGYDGFELPENWDFSLPKQLEEQGIARLPVHPQNCRMIQDLPFHHRDPFDRMIIAQALQGAFTVIGCDRIFEDYGVKRVW